MAARFDFRKVRGSPQGRLWVLACMEWLMACLLGMRLNFKPAFLFWASILAVLWHAPQAQLVFDDVDKLHPDFELQSLQNSDFKPQVSDLAWLPDGRLVMTTIHPAGQNITGFPLRISQLWIVPSLDSVTGDKAPRVIDTMTECVGVEVVDGKIYVAEKNQLTEYVLDSADAVLSKRKVADIPHDSDGLVNFQEFPFGLLYRSGYFYTANAGAVAYGGGSFFETPEVMTESHTGGVLKIKASDGGLELLNGGLRGCNGLIWGPDSSLWVTDNQGSWLPSSKLIAISPGRNYGYFNGPNGYNDIPVASPSLWLPHGEIARSPTQPAFITQGRYQGQFLIGDISQGGIKRAFIEKVAGEWQGAVFSFSGGLYAGVQKILMGPKGEIVVGELGQGDYQNWGWRGKTHGLEVLRPKSESKAFEILAVRSRRHGMELQFTAQLGEDFDEPEHWQWRMASMEPSTVYGDGNMVHRCDLTVRFTQLSEDRRLLYFEIDSLVEQRVLSIRALREITSEKGQALRCPAAWYTLNHISSSLPFDGDPVLSAATLSPMPPKPWVTARELRLKGVGAWSLRVLDIRGHVAMRLNGYGSQTLIRPPEMRDKMWIVEWSHAGHRESAYWPPI